MMMSATLTPKGSMLLIELRQPFRLPAEGCLPPLWTVSKSFGIAKRSKAGHRSQLEPTLCGRGRHGSSLFGMQIGYCYGLTSLDLMTDYKGVA